MVLLNVTDMTVSYQGREAVKHFSMDLGEGQICAIVGESGAGKTTVIRAIFGLLGAGGAVTSGSVTFDGESLLSLSRDDFRKLRGTKISMIFQDSGAMMNPTRKIGAVFAEYIRTHEKISKQEAWDKGTKMLQLMRLPDAGLVMKSYPFQLSGGMRQRVGIAMAMTYEPQLLLADEPTSALDVTTQAQIVRQMMELREQYHTSIVMVTHNLGVAAYMSDYIMVMKDGVVEDQGNREYILQKSENAYTKKLIDAVPTIGGVRYV